jgi:Photosynthesis system II assembly factor YCF48
MAAREDEKAMAGLLRRSLAQDTGAVAGPGSDENCPEPEILAAYFDHALDAEETARYDLHFSRCSHCREQLAAMARAGGVGDAAAAAGEKTAGTWAWLTGPRWLMPAAAMLVALLAIAGIALRIRKPVTPSNEIAMARPDALPQAHSAPVTTPAPQANSAPSPETALSSRAASSAPRAMDKIAVPPSAPSASRPGAAGVPDTSSESAASRELGAGLPSHTVSHANSVARGGAFPSAGVGSGAKSAAAPVMQPQAQKPAPRASSGMVRGATRTGSAGNASDASGSGGAESESGGGVGGAGVNSADQTVTVTEAAPALDTAEPTKVVPGKNAEAGSDSNKSDAQLSAEAETKPQPNARKTRTAATTSGAVASGAAAPAQSAKAMNLAANQTMEAAALAKMQQAQISSNLMNLQIQTPDPKILWMLTGAGAIEKSEDGGATWKLEYLDARARIIAGSAPSVKICWLVGEGGTILRTTNGTHWKTITPPDETVIVRVEATDALTATVTTLDGRRFSTSDGGKSWNSVK